MPEATRLVFPLLAAAILVAVTCYPNGAPGRDCWTERPLHGDFMPSHGDSPYEIKLTKIDPTKDPDTYTPGEIISGALLSLSLSVSVCLSRSLSLSHFGIYVCVYFCYD